VIFALFRQHRLPSSQGRKSAAVMILILGYFSSTLAVTAELIGVVCMVIATVFCFWTDLKSRSKLKVLEHA
jgi:uncharacterized membrane protein YqjE